MNVKELMDELAKMPPDAPVLRYHHSKLMFEEVSDVGEIDIVRDHRYECPREYHFASERKLKVFGGSKIVAVEI